MPSCPLVWPGLSRHPRLPAARRLGSPRRGCPDQVRAKRALSCGTGDRATCTVMDTNFRPTFVGMTMRVITRAFRSPATEMRRTGPRTGEGRTRLTSTPPSSGWGARSQPFGAFMGSAEAVEMAQLIATPAPGIPYPSLPAPPRGRRGEIRAAGPAKKPSPPFWGEREGTRAAAREGEVGAGNRSGNPHLTPSLSAPGGGEEDPARPPPWVYRRGMCNASVRSRDRWQEMSKSNAELPIGL